MPPVFHGVLRAIRASHGYKASSPEFLNEMEKLDTILDGLYEGALAKKPERNLLRYYGRYWKAFNLYTTGPGHQLSLTPFGNRVVSGSVSIATFASSVVAALELPNRNFDSPEDQKLTALWDLAGLKIRPLVLLIDVLKILRNTNYDNRYITPKDVWEIIIPLAGYKATPEFIAQQILNHRDGTLPSSVTNSWASCVPEDNDKRMVREYLLFLEYNGYCKTDKIGLSNQLEKYYLVSNNHITIAALPMGETIEAAALDQTVQQTAEDVERDRKTVTVLNRSGQKQFKKDVVSASGGKCLVTGTNFLPVLEAAHIWPAEYHGSDHKSNGFLLRADIHTLFDAGDLRIHPDGSLHLSEPLRATPYGVELERRRISIPPYVDMSQLEKRIRLL